MFSTYIRIASVAQHRAENRCASFDISNLYNIQHLFTPANNGLNRTQLLYRSNEHTERERETYQ